MNNTTQDTELFELCKQVYEKTGWKGGDSFITTIGGKWISDSKKGWYDETIGADGFYPLYTSDYLLEKLPPVIQDPYDKIFKHIQMWVNGDKSTHAGYVEPYAHGDKVTYAQESDKMRKTLLKLTLALHESGELRLERANDE